MSNRFRNYQSSITDNAKGMAADVGRWGYWAMNEGSGNVLSNDVRSNVALTDVALAGTGGTEWNNVSWLTGDSANLKGTLTYAGDNDLALLADFNNASAIIGFQILSPVATGGRDTILHIGGSSGATRYGLWVAQENTATNDRLIYQMRDNAGTASSLSYSNGSLAMDGATVFTCILTIDGNTDQMKLDGVDNSAPGTELQGAANDYSALGDMTFSTQGGTPGLNIMVDTSSSPLYFGGQLRRLLIVNYGAFALPSNLTQIKESLYKSEMLPTRELLTSAKGAAL